VCVGVLLAFHLVALLSDDCASVWNCKLLGHDDSFKVGVLITFLSLPAKCRDYSIVVLASFAWLLALKRYLLLGLGLVFISQ
jgi:hypothetical protein